jgi:PleD family two-component response regulator
VAGAHTLRATVSGGVALFPDDGTTWDSLFGAVDRRLYEAKRSGRNRVVADDRQTMVHSGGR